MQNENAILFDYKNQAWTKGGVYLNCGHPDDMPCGCFGRINQGEKVPAERLREMADPFSGTKIGYDVAH